MSASGYTSIEGDQTSTHSSGATLITCTQRRAPSRAGSRMYTCRVDRAKTRAKELRSLTSRLFPRSCLGLSRSPFLGPSLPEPFRPSLSGLLLSRPRLPLRTVAGAEAEEPIPVLATRYEVFLEVSLLKAIAFFMLVVFWHCSPCDKVGSLALERLRTACRLPLRSTPSDNSRPSFGHAHACVSARSTPTPGGLERQPAECSSTVGDLGRCSCDPAAVSGHAFTRGRYGGRGFFAGGVRRQFQVRLGCWNSRCKRAFVLRKGAARSEKH